MQWIGVRNMKKILRCVSCAFRNLETSITEEQKVEEGIPVEESTEITKWSKGPSAVRNETILGNFLCRRRSSRQKSLVPSLLSVQTTPSTVPLLPVVGAYEEGVHGKEYFLCEWLGQQGKGKQTTFGNCQGNHLAHPHRERIRPRES